MDQSKESIVSSTLKLAETHPDLNAAELYAEEEEFASGKLLHFRERIPSLVTMQGKSSTQGCTRGGRRSNAAEGGRSSRGGV
jgi:hypothetical protein